MAFKQGKGDWGEGFDCHSASMRMPNCLNVSMALEKPSRITRIAAIARFSFADIIHGRIA
jgi:hypothetical protein